MSSRVLAFRGDNIVIRHDPADPASEREYRVTGSEGRLMLEPVLPTVPGYYMTTNNISHMGGVLIELETSGDWVLHTGAGERGHAAKQQVQRWLGTLGLTRVYLTTTPPKETA